MKLITVLHVHPVGYKHWEADNCTQLTRPPEPHINACTHSFPHIHLKGLLYPTVHFIAFNPHLQLIYWIVTKKNGICANLFDLTVYCVWYHTSLTWLKATNNLSLKDTFHDTDILSLLSSFWQQGSVTPESGGRGRWLGASLSWPSWWETTN